MRVSIRIAAALWLALAGLCLAVPSAGAYVYWTNDSAGTIGRATNDGSVVEPSFITGQPGPFSVAVDAGHIYWADVYGHAIGRATISGTSVEPEFIKLPYEANGVAVNNEYLYWSNGPGGRIGRAHLDGSNPETEFVKNAGSPCGLALDNGHIYWAEGILGPGFISRVGLSGTPLQLSFVEVGTVKVLCGVAVSPGNVYWTDYGAGLGTNIGHANLNDPSMPDDSFIGAALGPCGITVFDSMLYWANSGTSTIARANTDNSGEVDYEYIRTGEPPDEICGIAVDSLAPQPPPGGGGGGGAGGEKPPPQTTIKSGPGKKLAQGKARFSFTSNEAGSTFECRLDRKKIAPCHSPKSYKDLRPGRHSFSVWATDAAGSKDPTPAKRSVRVRAG